MFIKYKVKNAKFLYDLMMLYENYINYILAQIIINQFSRNF